MPAAWVYGHLPEDHATQCQLIHRSASLPGGPPQRGQGKWESGLGNTDMHLYFPRCGRHSSNLVAVVGLLVLARMYSVGNLTGKHLTRNSCLDGLGGMLCWWRKPQIFHSDSGVSSSVSKGRAKPPHSREGLEERASISGRWPFASNGGGKIPSWPSLDSSAQASSLFWMGDAQVIRARMPHPSGHPSSDWNALVPQCCGCSDDLTPPSGRFHVLF